MLAMLCIPRVESSCLTSPPRWRPCTSQPRGRSTREVGPTASLHRGTEETEEIEATEEIGAEVDVVVEETTGDLALQSGTERRTGTGEDHLPVVVMTTTTHPAGEEGTTDGAEVRLVVGEEEDATTADTSTMTTAATTITATPLLPGERTRRTSFPTTWTISPLRTTLWPPGLSSLVIWNST